jgi:hypothetical protein
MEMLAQAISEAPDILFRPYFESLGYEWDKETGQLRPLEGDAALGEVHVGFSREGVARRSKVKNLAGQRLAARELTERLFGKPRQAMELASSSGAGGITMPVNIERAQIVSHVLKEAGAIPGLGPAADQQTDVEEEIG